MFKSNYSSQHSTSNTRLQSSCLERSPSDSNHQQSRQSSSRDHRKTSPYSSSIRFQLRPKLKWVTNTEPVIRTNQRKKRSLAYDDDDEDEIENTPILKRQSTLPKDNYEAIKSNRPSVIDNEELDFL